MVIPMEKNKIATNATFLLLTSIITSGAGYVFHFICIRFLAVSEYGMYTSVLPIYNITLTVGALGLLPSTVKHIAESIGKNDYQKVGKVIISAVQLAFVMAIVYSLFLFFFREIIAVSFLKDYTLIPLIFLCAPLVALQILKIVPRGIFLGYQKMINLTIISTAEQTVRIVFLIFFFYIGFRAEAPLIAWIFAVLVSLIVALILIKRLKTPLKTVDFKSVDFPVVKSLVFFGFFIAGTEVLEIAMKSVDVLGLKIITQSNDLVAYYGTAFIVASLLLMIPSAIGGATFPYIAKKRGESGVVKSDLMFGSMFFVMLPLIFGMEFFLGEFIVLMFKQRYLPALIPASVLILGVFFYTVYIICFSFIATSKNPKRIFYVLLFVVLINIIGNLMLIPKYTTLGASVATSISYLFCGVGSLLILKKNGELPDFLIWKIVMIDAVFLSLVYIVFYQSTFQLKVVISVMSIMISILPWKIYYPELIEMFRSFLKNLMGKKGEF